MKALIRLRGCAVWSGPSLSAFAQRHVFAWRAYSLVGDKALLVDFRDSYKEKYFCDFLFVPPFHPCTQMPFENMSEREQILSVQRRPLLRRGNFFSFFFFFFFLRCIPRENIHSTDIILHIYENVMHIIYYISNNDFPICLCRRKPCHRSPVNYFVSSNELCSRAN